MVNKINLITTKRPNMPQIEFKEGSTSTALKSILRPPALKKTPSMHVSFNKMEDKLVIFSKEEDKDKLKEIIQRPIEDIETQRKETFQTLVNCTQLIPDNPHVRLALTKLHCQMECKGEPTLTLILKENKPLIRQLNNVAILNNITFCVSEVINGVDGTPFVNYELFYNEGMIPDNLEEFIRDVKNILFPTKELSSLSSLKDKERLFSLSMLINADSSFLPNIFIDRYERRDLRKTFTTIGFAFGNNELLKNKINSLASMYKIVLSPPYNQEYHDENYPILNRQYVLYDEATGKLPNSLELFVKSVMRTIRTFYMDCKDCKQEAGVSDYKCIVGSDEDKTSFSRKLLF